MLIVIKINQEFDTSWRVLRIVGEELPVKLLCKIKGGPGMAGTKNGGKLAASTNKKRYGKEFYVRIGAMGGKVSKGGGFAANPELARIAGAKGGRASRKQAKAA